MPHRPRPWRAGERGCPRPPSSPPRQTPARPPPPRPPRAPPAEAAPPAAGAGDRKVLLANSIYHLTNDGAVTVLAGQITVLQVAFAFGPFETGLLSGAALLITGIFQMVFGAMSDRRDPSRFPPVGILILGVGTLLVAAATSFLAPLLIIAVSRIGAGFFYPLRVA